MALYRKLLDPTLQSSNKIAMFLNLLYKSLKSDQMERRVQVVCLSLKHVVVCAECKYLNSVEILKFWLFVDNLCRLLKPVS